MSHVSHNKPSLLVHYFLVPSYTIILDLFLNISNIKYLFSFITCLNQPGYTEAMTSAQLLFYSHLFSRSDLSMLAHVIQYVVTSISLFE